MNVHGDFELLVGRWLDATAPALTPVAVHDEAMVSVRRSRQHARWSAAVRAGLFAPAGKPSVRLISIVGVAAVLVAGSFGWALVSTGSPSGPAVSIQPASPSTQQNAVLPSAPLSALPPPIPDVLSADIESTLLDKGFKCITQDLAAEGRSRVECNKGAEYVVSWRGRGPTSVHYIQGTITGVSESYAASFIGAILYVCGGPQETWAFSNIHSGGETTFGPVRVRLTVVAAGQWRFEIMGA